LKAAEGPRADYIRTAADRALLSTNRYARPADPDITQTNVAVHPAGATLPPSFLAQDWTTFGNAYRYVPPPLCVRGLRSAMCDAWMMDLDSDGADEIVLLERETAHLFQFVDQRVWTHVGSWSLPLNCPRIALDMMAGRFASAAPRPSRWPDLEIAGMRLRLLENSPLPACPN
jgi:hypothetical protein